MTTPEQRTAAAVLAVRRACAGHLSAAAVETMIWHVRRINEPDLAPPVADRAAAGRYARRP